MSKAIYEPMVHFAQNVQLSCTDTYTVSNQKEVRFHMTHVIWEFHWVHPNDFHAYGMFDANRAAILRQD